MPPCLWRSRSEVDHCREPILVPVLRVDRGRDIGEHLFDRCLHLIYIYVSHDDNRLQVRTIPFFVVSPQLVRLEVLDHVDRTDRHPVRVTASRVHLGSCCSHRRVWASCRVRHSSRMTPRSFWIAESVKARNPDQS